MQDGARAKGARRRTRELGAGDAQGRKALAPVPDLFLRSMKRRSCSHMRPRQRRCFSSHACLDKRSRGREVNSFEVAGLVGEVAGGVDVLQQHAQDGQLQQHSLACTSPTWQ